MTGVTEAADVMRGEALMEIRAAKMTPAIMLEIARGPLVIETSAAKADRAPVSEEMLQSSLAGSRARVCLADQQAWPLASIAVIHLESPPLHLPIGFPAPREAAVLTASVHAVLRPILRRSPL